MQPPPGVLAPRGPDSDYNFYTASGAGTGKRKCYFDTTATSHALAQLQQYAMVTARREGRYTYYEADTKGALEQTVRRAYQTSSLSPEGAMPESLESSSVSSNSLSESGSAPLPGFKPPSFRPDAAAMPD